MRRLTIWLAATTLLVLTGFLIWKVEAMPLVTAPKHYSPIEAVGCNSIGACPLGMQKVCTNRRCWCESCGRVSRSVVVRPVFRPFVFRPVIHPWRWLW
jgi:hypothetical protein